MDSEPSLVSLPEPSPQTFNNVRRQRFVYKPKRLHFSKENTVKEQPIGSITPANSTMEETKETTPPQEQQGGETAGTGNDYPITLLESELGQHSDPGNVTQEDTSSIEGSIPLEAVPSMDVTPVETEGNDTLSEVESVHKTPLRKSVDSDPGDFVKIDNADNGNQEEHGEPAKLKRVGGDGEQTTERGAGDVESKKLPTATVNPLASEEEKKDVEAKSSEVEQPQEVPAKKSEDKSPYGGLRQWMEKNPAAVRCAATAAAVAGLAGIGAFVYARRVRSGGV
uniref:ANK_REP_REGION domain-containing protein n=1 Tax=Haemonchus contortus TaxID=6289 RepID=A0A7I5ED77_HAECO